MTHERDNCPLYIKKRQDELSVRSGESQLEIPKRDAFLKDSDPLYGVLGEHQVGIDPNSGRPRIAPIVLEGMRQYLRVSSEGERLLRVDKVQQSVSEVENPWLKNQS